MKKSYKKKNWLEKLNDLDTQQQSQLSGMSKDSRSKKNTKPTVQLPKYVTPVVVVLSLLLPFLGWGFGASSNPSGWMSSDPSTVIFSMLLSWYYWVPVAIIVIVLLVRRYIVNGLIVLFVASLLGALYIASTTANASDSEFTG